MEETIFFRKVLFVSFQTKTCRRLEWNELYKIASVGLVYLVECWDNNHDKMHKLFLVFM